LDLNTGDKVSQTSDCKSPVPPGGRRVLTGERYESTFTFVYQIKTTKETMPILISFESGDFQQDIEKQLLLGNIKVHIERELNDVAVAKKANEPEKNFIEKVTDWWNGLLSVQLVGVICVAVIAFCFICALCCCKNKKQRKSDIVNMIDYLPEGLSEEGDNNQSDLVGRRRPESDGDLIPYMSTRQHSKSLDKRISNALIDGTTPLGSNQFVGGQSIPNRRQSEDGIYSEEGHGTEGEGSNTTNQKRISRILDV